MAGQIIVSLPAIRLYRLPGRDVWYADTKRATGKRWQFSTGETDENTARVRANAKVAGEFQETSPEAPTETEAPRSTEQSGGANPSSFAERLRRAATGGRADGASSEPDPPVEETTPEGEMLADVISMAATLGITAGVAKAIRKRQWKEDGKTGHFEPGPANEQFLELLQSKLRQKAIDLFGTKQIGPWVGIGLGAAGVAVTMAWNAERVTDGDAKQNGTTQARREAGHEKPATEIRPEFGAAQARQEGGPPKPPANVGGVQVTDLSIFKRGDPPRNPGA